MTSVTSSKRPSSDKPSIQDIGQEIDRIRTAKSLGTKLKYFHRSLCEPDQDEVEQSIKKLESHLAGLNDITTLTSVDPSLLELCDTLTNMADSSMPPSLLLLPGTLKCVLSKGEMTEADHQKYVSSVDYMSHWRGSYRLMK